MMEGAILLTYYSNHYIYLTQGSHGDYHSTVNLRYNEVDFPWVGAASRVVIG